MNPIELIRHYIQRELHWYNYWKNQKQKEPQCAESSEFMANKFLKSLENQYHDLNIMCGFPNSYHYQGEQPD